MLFETERLIIRRFTAADLHQDCAYLSDPVVMEYIEEPFSTTQTERFIIEHGRCAQPPVYAMQEKATGLLKGHFIFHPYNGDEQVYELGWIMAKEAWGRGYATEVGRAGIGYAFGSLGVRKVVADAMEDNERSRSVLVRIGMAAERVTGDVLHFAITNSFFVV